MFVLFKTTGTNESIAINPEHVRSIAGKTASRSIIAFSDGDAVSVDASLDLAMDMLKGKPTSNRARKTTVEKQPAI